MPRIRTGYSFRAAAGILEDVMARIKECEFSCAPITDRASTFGFNKWSKLCAKNDIKPVYGIELAVAESYEEKKPTVDYWTFIAIDTIEPLNRLITLATEQFRYQPIITYEDALAAEGVFKVVGHRCKLDKVRLQDNLFYGLGPASSRGHVRKAKELGMKFVATSDNRFVKDGDQGFYEVLVGRGAETQTYDQHIQNNSEWMNSTDRTGLTSEERFDALATRDWIWSQSSAQLKKAELVHPPRPATLRVMCEQGAERIGCDINDPVYKARLDRELELIEAKGYEDYFYLVADICQWSRKRMAVGPARGSSCGSLVCYLLEITTVDPIPFGLIFERFIDINRSDMPDVDIDFSDQQRHRVFSYIEDTYGADHTARLGTVTMYKARSALQEAGAALRVPRWQCDSVAESLIERSGGDSRALDTLEDTLRTMDAGRKLLDEWPEILVATRMEGHPRHYSQHAAGVVVAAEPIAKYVAVDHRTNATMCDKNDAEDLNLLKIDALGLTQLSVFEDALKMAGLTMNDLQKAPLDDQAAFDVLNRGEFSGIFQWNGSALQGLTKQITADRFDDVVAISALARPGPLATGGASQWVKRRNGSEAVTTIHPMLTELTKETYGVVVYQETVMRIVREMGNMSWEDTSAIRKAMSKRLGGEFFEQFKRKFITGALENGVDEAKATEIWDQINTFGSWAFNKSHAVAYGFISYWCCWMKAHFPFEFAAATLSHEKDPMRQIQILREMKAEGYDYVPVDAEKSEDKWTSGWIDGKRVLIGPLHNVNGIGPKLMGQVLASRRRGDPMPSRAQKLLSDPKTEIDSLWPIRDAFNRTMPDPMDRNITTPPTPIESIAVAADPYPVLVFCTLAKINPRDENEAINVQKRGYEITDGKVNSLNLQLVDDTGSIFGKVNRFKFASLGKEIIDRGRAGKALYAIKGQVRGSSDFRMISIDAVRYIGDLTQ